MLRIYLTLYFREIAAAADWPLDVEVRESPPCSANWYICPVNASHFPTLCSQLLNVNDPVLCTQVAHWFIQTHYLLLGLQYLYLAIPFCHLQDHSAFSVLRSINGQFENALRKASLNSSSYVALCMPSPLNINFFCSC